MGNKVPKPNVTFTSSNDTESMAFNVSLGSIAGVSDKLYHDAMRPVAAGITLRLISAVLSVLMIVVLSKRLRPEYALLQNIFVADFVAAILTTPLWVLGMLLDAVGGLVLADVCRTEGFLITSLQTVFLWAVTATAIGQFRVLAPLNWSQHFSTPVVRRLLALSLWTGSGLLCAAPLNDGIHLSWGMYGRLGHICWVAWETASSRVLSFAVLHTCLTLVPAVLCSVFALVFLHLKINNSVRPDGIQNKNGRARSDSEVLYITSAMLLVFVSLWLPLTIIQPNFLGKKSDLRRRLEAFYVTYFMFGRGFFNVLVAMAISGRLRGGFADVILKCKCSAEPNAPMADGLEI